QRYWLALVHLYAHRGRLSVDQPIGSELERTGRFRSWLLPEPLLNAAVARTCPGAMLAIRHRAIFAPRSWLSRRSLATRRRRTTLRCRLRCWRLPTVVCARCLGIFSIALSCGPCDSAVMRTGSAAGLRSGSVVARHLGLLRRVGSSALIRRGRFVGLVGNGCRYTAVMRTCASAGLRRRPVLALHLRHILRRLRLGLGAGGTESKARGEDDDVTSEEVHVHLSPERYPARWRWRASAWGKGARSSLATAATWPRRPEPRIISLSSDVRASEPRWVPSIRRCADLSA